MTLVARSGALLCASGLAIAVLLTGCQAMRTNSTTSTRTASNSSTKSSTSTHDESKGRVQVYVVATTDGDTFRVNLNGRPTRIRILNINAPEVSHDGRPQQCGGEAARTALDKMIWHKRVTLTRGQGSADRDQYGRPLRYVELNGVDVGLAMIEQGRASEYHPRTVAAESRTATYLAAQRSAMRAHRGQWSTCTITQEGKQ